MNALCRHALAFARRGMPVIPLYGKTPIGSLAPHGARNGSIDPETIRRWWCMSPSANIGVTLPFHLVLDIDPRNHGDGALIELERRHSFLPNTWRSLTGGGGEHIWLALPDGADIRGGNNRLGSGLDVKTGRHSYVVAPPSLHQSGARYEWRREAHPCEAKMAIAPDWLVRLLTPTATEPVTFEPRPDDDERIGIALARIPAHDHDIWLRVGMALHAHFGGGGLEIWDRWSQASEKYQPGVCARRWRSFRGGAIGLGTIFHLAKEYGRAA